LIGCENYMLVICNCAEKEWCPQKDECSHYKSHECGKHLDGDCLQTTCYDNDFKKHKVECIEVDQT
jgi:hypothetical protein